jgi:oligopeptide/dipeptide ABC transporter ATP-binding protein
MRGGLIVESGSRQQVFQNPQHPYTRELLDAMPDAQDSLVDAPAESGSALGASAADADAADTEENR